MRSWLLRLTATALLFSITACYTYAPVVQPVAAGERMRVRAELTDLGSAQLRGYLGPGIERLEGMLVDADDRSVTLAVAMTSGRRGENYWSGETATLPRDAIESMQRRAFSSRRTLLASAAVVAGALALARMFQGGSSAGGIRVPDDSKK